MEPPNLTNSAADGPAASGDRELLVVLPLSDADMGTKAERAAYERLAERLEARVRTTAAGEYNGDETGAGEVTLFFSGDDECALISEIHAILADAALDRAARFERMMHEDDGTTRRELLRR